MFQEAWGKASFMYKKLYDTALFTLNLVSTHVQTALRVGFSRFLVVRCCVNSAPAAGTACTLVPNPRKNLAPDTLLGGTLWAPVPLACLPCLCPP